jgi:hypothetical protein
MTATPGRAPGLCLIVSGGQPADRAAVFTTLDGVHARSGIRFLIQANSAGAAYFASEWANERGIPCGEYPLNWDEHGKNAQQIRNQEMIDKSNPDGVIAWPGGPGPTDLVRRAKKAGLTVWKPRP